MTYRDSNARTETRSGNHSNGRDDGRNCPVRPQLVNCDDSTCGRSVNRKESVKTFEGNISRDCCGSIEQSERRNSDNGSGRESIVFPSLEIINGKPTTTSLQVAEYFGKRHDNVIRDIKNILEKRPDLRLLNFEETQQIVKIGAVERQIVVYRMDRKGFTLLSMGFTGVKAMDFKIAYIDAFDEMERQLLKKEKNIIVSMVNALPDQYKPAVFEAFDQAHSGLVNVLKESGAVVCPFYHKKRTPSLIVSDTDMCTVLRLYQTLNEDDLLMLMRLFKDFLRVIKSGYYARYVGLIDDIHMSLAMLEPMFERNKIKFR